jgi:hypothetical protein
MFRRRKQSGGIRHLGEDELLLHFDGELTGKAADAARAHLQECWECHTRLKLLEDAVTDFMQDRAADLDRVSALPPHAAVEFRSKLHREAADTRPPWTRRLAAALEPWRPWALAGAVLGLAALGFLGIGSNGPSTVSANEFLQRAEQRETAALRQVAAPVVYQKLRVRKAAGNAATVEVWSDRQNARVYQRGDVQSWRGLEAIYRSNGFTGGPPLSPVAFLTWRNGLALKKDEVTRAKLDDGSDAIRLRTSAPAKHGAGQVREATLLIRTRDMHPVGQQLGTDDGAIELTELAYQVLPLAVVGTALFEPPRALPAPLPSPFDIGPPAVDFPHPAVPEPATVSLDDVEVEVQYFLHRLGACRGEEITVGRSAAGHIRVSGIVDSGERKRELQLALAEQAQVDLELRSVEEVAAALPAHETVAATAHAMEVRSQGIPIEDELKHYFASAPEGDGGLAASLRFANRGLSGVQTAMLEAWALRRLAEGYGPQRARDLRPFSISLLTQMVEDHNHELASQLARVRGEMAPVLAGIFGIKPRAVQPEPTAGWTQSALRTFGAVRRVASLTQALLAGDNSAAPPQPAAQELLDHLEEFEPPRR